MKKIKAAIIGLGKIGFDYSKYKKNYSYFGVLKNFSNINLVSVCDTKKKNIKIFKNSKILFYRDYKKMIRELSLDLIVISSSDESHYKIASHCLQNNIKFLIVEKPLTNSLSELRYFNNLIKYKKLNFEINYTRNYLKFFQNLKIKIAKNSEKISNLYITFNNGLFHNGCHYFVLLFYLFGPNIKVIFSNLKPSKYLKKDFQGKIILKIKNQIMITIDILDDHMLSIDEFHLTFEKKRILIKDDYAYYYKRGKHEKFFNFKKYNFGKKIKIDYDNALSNLIKATINQKTNQITNNIYLTKKALLLTNEIIKKNVNK